MCLAALPSALHGWVCALDEVHRVPMVGAELAEQAVGGRAARGRRLAVVDGGGLARPGHLPDVLGEALVVLVGLTHWGNQLHCVPSDGGTASRAEPGPMSSHLRFSNLKTMTDWYCDGEVPGAPHAAPAASCGEGVVTGAVVVVVVAARDRRLRLGAGAGARTACCEHEHGEPESEDASRAPTRAFADAASVGRVIESSRHPPMVAGGAGSSDRGRGDRNREAGRSSVHE